MRARKSAYTAFALFLAAAFGIAAASGMAHAQQTVAVKLFKLITAKDEIVVGITDAEMKSFGMAPDLENLAQHLTAVGQITVWQYAVKHDKDGNLVQAPLRRVAIFKSDTLRIEPVNPAPLKVMAPDDPAKP